MKKILLIVLCFSFCSAFSEAAYTFIGKLNNKYSVHMRLTLSANNEISGSYYYLSMFKPIFLNGTKNGDVISLNELDENGKVIAVFKGTLKGEVFSGTWIKFDSTTMRFALTRKDWIASPSDHFSGTYTIGTPKEAKEGTICCMILPNGKMGICLSYNKGYPGYHEGELQGIAVTKGAGIYEYNAKPDEDANPCHIVFTFKNGSLEVDQSAKDSTCGFGANVNISGTYKKASTKFGIETCIY